MTAIAPTPVSGPATRGASRRPGRRRTTPGRVGFLLVAVGIPLVVFLGLVIWPFVQAISYSFTSWSGFSSSFGYIGVDNYTRLFSDDLFLTSVKNSLLLAFLLPIITIVIALVFASLVTIAGPSTGPVRGIRGSSFYRVVSFFPYVVPAIVAGLVWAQVFDPSNGLLNGLLTGLGFDSAASFPWLGDPRTARWALIFVMVWAAVGFYMVLFVAAIKDIPAETFEAARLDGAGRGRMILSVVIPAIRGNVRTAWIYIGIGALDAFVFVQALVPNGGPDNTALVIGQLILRTAFDKGQFGYACAMGVVLAIMTMLFAGVVGVLVRLLTGSDGTERKKS